ncbi:MAG: hypothetical protein O2822_06805 [Chloroflexi bacterium]|nr:hypothetical protein [Chloroflexota bacterium]
MNDTSNAPFTIDAMIERMRLVRADAAPVLTASIDLGVGADGQPTAARMLRQAVREAIGRYPDDPARHARESLEDDAEALEAMIQEATAHGAAGLIYVGSRASDVLMTLETLYPIRNAVDIADEPSLFELTRYRYLAGTGVVLAEISLREVAIRRVQYAVTDATQSVEPSERIEKLKQRTGRDQQGAPDGSGGHSMNSVERHIQEHRVQYAADAAEQIVAMMQPGDLLLFAGTDSGRGAIRRQLPDGIGAAAIDAGQLDPTQDERSQAAWLMELAVQARYAHADAEAARWFEGAWGDLALAGIESVRRAADEGRVATMIVNEDAVDHFGTATDARDQAIREESRAVEGVVRAALAQAASILVTRDARVLTEQQGVLAVARY